MKESYAEETEERRLRGGGRGETSRGWRRRSEKIVKGGGINDWRHGRGGRRAVRVFEWERGTRAVIHAEAGDVRGDKGRRRLEIT